MRYGPDHKAETRKHILDSAAAVFRRMGYHAGSVDTVMREAGLTAGGFYAHFASKDALFAETLPHAMRQTRTLTNAESDSTSGADWIKPIVDRYLSMGHRSLVDKGCPLPPLLPEVARGKAEARQRFEEVLKQIVTGMESHLPSDQRKEKQELPLAILATMIGGLTLSRAVSDEQLAENILLACRNFIETAVTSSSAKPRKANRRSTSKRKSKS